MHKFAENDKTIAIDFHKAMNEIRFDAEIYRVSRNVNILRDNNGHFEYKEYINSYMISRTLTVNCVLNRR